MVFPAEVYTVVWFSACFPGASVGPRAVPCTLCFSGWSCSNICGIEVHRIGSCLVCLFRVNLALLPACLRLV